MPRPKRFRSVRFQPNTTYFKPSGIPVRELEESVLTVDEFEAVRLKDLEGLQQEAAAKKMNVSQPTFFRLLDSARKKLADAIVNGKAIKIEGGVYKMVGIRGHGGRGRMRGPLAAGPGGTCVCPKCKNRIPHKVGIPCYQVKCPKCGSSMIRGD
jgi:predicted DNA-binding protein (UPF0251 family)